MHKIHHHPEHDFVDLDLSCPLSEGPNRLDLCCTYKGRPPRRSWYFMGSDGRSYHFPPEECYDCEAVEAFALRSGYRMHPDWLQGELAYVRD